MRNHVIAHIGTTRLAKVDAGVLNGLYVQLLTSGRRLPSRTGRGYSREVVARATRPAGRRPVARSDGRAVADRVRRGGAHRRKTRSPRCFVGSRSDERSTSCPMVSTVAPSTTSTRSSTERSRTRSAGAGLARNPADAADPPRAGQKSDGVHAWEAATLRTFLSKSRESGDRLHALWVLLATTGMRRGEALGLRWKDVDLETGRLSVVQTITQTRSKVTIGEPKTSSGRRSIALDECDGRRVARSPQSDARGAHARRPRLLRRGPGVPPPRRCLPPPHAVSAQFLRRVVQCGLPRLTLHGLRHTWATLALEQGIHPRVVQERLGHSTIAITLGIYSHVSPTLHDEAAASVASLLL